MSPLRGSRVVALAMKGPRAGAMIEHEQKHEHDDENPVTVDWRAGSALSA